MYGDIKTINDHCLFIEGLFPQSILTEPDTANSLIYSKNNTLYIFDTGATPFFKEKILNAAKRLGSFEKVILFNTHSHPDHTGNNDLILELGAKEIKHYILGNYHPFPFAELFSQGMQFMNQFYQFLDSPEQALPFAQQSLHLFEPLLPSPETVTPLESLPETTFKIGEETFSGWEIEEIQIIKSTGHAADHCMFYLPEIKLLISGDETFPIFPLFPDANANNIIQNLNSIKKLAVSNHLNYLVDGHHTRIFTTKEVISLTEELLNHHNNFNQKIRNILSKMKTAVINDIFAQFMQDKDDSTTLYYLKNSFPQMPIDLRSVIVLTLLPLNPVISGPDGAKSFSLRNK